MAETSEVAIQALYVPLLDLDWQKLSAIGVRVTFGRIAFSTSTTYCISYCAFLLSNRSSDIQRSNIPSILRVEDQSASK